MFVDFEVGNLNYKLKMSVSAIMQLEKRLGFNPVLIFGKDGQRIPTVGEMVAILHASMQKYHHGISYNEATNCFEAWLDQGHTINDFLPILVEIYRESGLIAKEDDSKN